MVKACAILFLTCFFAFPSTAGASSAGQHLSFVPFCLTTTNLDELEIIAKSQGWIAPANSDEELISGLAWIGVSQYFVGDSGGERVEAVLDLKTKSAKGLLRKKDIPQSMNRYYVRDTSEGGEVLHMMWRQPVPNVIEIECRASLRPNSMSEIRHRLGAQKLPAFAQIPTEPIENGAVSVTLLNENTLAPLAPPDAIVTTYRMVKTEKVTP